MVYFLKMFRCLCLSWITGVLLLAGSIVLQADTTAGTDKANATRSIASQDQPAVFFPETRHEFDPVMEGVEIKHDFVIENRGRAPLIINNVRPD
jgi:hypothetical protein